MKKITHVICAFLILHTVNAQQEKGIEGYDNWLDDWTEFKPNKNQYKEPNQILVGNISVNTKLVKKKVYLLHGNVYVTNNAVLTIEPGTLIIGDFDTKGTLIVTKGASIIADGLETDPIVFTSNRSQKKAGDWGGIIILGNAPLNKFGNGGSYDFDLDPRLTAYGGTNSDANSGILRFVRIEFAGKRTKDLTSALNGLTIAGVGRKTILENIMVSYSGGNSFVFLGGCVNASKLVSYRSITHDFKFTQGVQCNFSNSLAVRSSYLSSNKDKSRCIEVRSSERSNETDFTKKQTSVIAANITLLNDSENIENDITAGLIREGVYVGENTSLEMKRSVISGFNPAVLLDAKIKINSNSLKAIKFQEILFNQCSGNIFNELNFNNDDLEHWYGNSIFLNVYSQNNNKETFIDMSNSKRPDYRLQLGKVTSIND